MPKLIIALFTFLSHYLCKVQFLCLLFALCLGVVSWPLQVKGDSLFNLDPATTFYVDALHGADSNNGSASSPWKTISHAEDMISAGAAVIVRPGNYASLYIDNGGTPENPTLFISEIKNAAKIAGVTISAGNVTVENFDIESIGGSAAGVFLNSGDNIKIAGNYIHHCASNGIRSQPAVSNFEISNNLLYQNAGIGIRLEGSYGLVENNEIRDMVSYLPGKSTDAGDGDGFVLAGDHHIIRGNTISNMVDPTATEFFLAGHTPHIDCFQVNTVFLNGVDDEPLTNALIENNFCWSDNFNRALLIETYTGGKTSHDITIRNNIFEFLGSGLIIKDRATDYDMANDERNQPYYNIKIENNIFKSQTKTNTTAERVAIRLFGIHNYSVLNNITVDCDNHTNPEYSGQDIDIGGGAGIHDFNFAWSSTGAIFTGPAGDHESPGPHSRNDLTPLFVRYAENIQGGNDYRLRRGSPLIDSGTGIFEIMTNYDAQPHFTGSSMDTGVHEFVMDPGDASSIDIAVVLSSPCAGNSISFSIPLWKDNKDAAVMFDFDDGTEGQRSLGLPLFQEKGLKGTWFINPGTKKYTDYKYVWSAFSNDQEFANHTMNHGDNYTTLEEWDAEVLDAARAIWQVRGECGEATGIDCSSLGQCAGGQCLDTSQGNTLGLPLQNENIPIIPNMGGSLMSVCVSDSNSSTWGDWRMVDLLYQFSYNNIDQTSAVYNPLDSSATVKGYTCTINNTAFTKADGYLCSGTSALGYINTAINNPFDASSAKFVRLRGHNIINSSPTASAISRDELSEFLDILSNSDVVGSVADRIWSAGTVEMYKYASESLNSSVIPVPDQQCSNRSYFDLTINDNAKNYRTDGSIRLYQEIKGATIAQGAKSGSLLFDEPITVMLTNTGWLDGQECTAIQETAEGNLPRSCYIKDGTVYVEAVPDMGKVLVIGNNT